MADILTIAKERKMFLEELAEEGDRFFIDLQRILKQKGIPISERDIRGVYTVATQLFHRLWWDNSRNRIQRYKKSRQGMSYLDLLLKYKKLRKFPPCLSGLCDTLRHKLITRAYEICETLNIDSNEELIENKEVVGYGLNNDFSDVNTVVSSIASIKKSSGNRKRAEKDALRRDSITSIVIPIIWNNLVEDFITDPRNFVGF